MRERVSVCVRERESERERELVTRSRRQLLVSTTQFIQGSTTVNIHEQIPISVDVTPKLFHALN